MKLTTAVSAGKRPETVHQLFGILARTDFCAVIKHSIGEFGNECTVNFAAREEVGTGSPNKVLEEIGDELSDSYGSCYEISSAQ